MCDPEQPVFHVGPKEGWVNDPNGPIYYGGRYHLFYQHVPTGCEWKFGLVWGHACSTDLVRWEHLPHALLPSPGSVDADGCFSGCCAVTEEGTPVILYTGVRLRSNPECGPLPPEECDLQLPFIETQCCAVGDPSDPLLRRWVKQEPALISLPPANMDLIGWRDPFLVTGPTGAIAREHTMLLGSGIKNKGGAIMKYRSSDLLDGWEYDGLLCQGPPGLVGDMWECPLLVNLASTVTARSSEPAPFDLVQEQEASSCWAVSDATAAAQLPQQHGAQPAPKQQPAAAGSRDDIHFLCVSPDNPNKATVYWLGPCEAGKFLLDQATGPFPLDLGDTLYAPNVMWDPQGRCMLWGWLQERRSRVGAFQYSGCMGAPRLLSVVDGRLQQAPAPEVAQLREKLVQQDAVLHLEPDAPVVLPASCGTTLDMEFELVRGSASAAGVHIKSWSVGTEAGLGIFVNWASGQLEAIHEGLDPESGLYSLTAPTARKVGGELTCLDTTPEGHLKLRVLLDNSLVEVFTGAGQVLSTRVYRGAPFSTGGAQPESNIQLVAEGGAARVVGLRVYSMATIWKKHKYDAAQPFEGCELLYGSSFGTHTFPMATPEPHALEQQVQQMVLV